MAQQVLRSTTPGPPCLISHFAPNPLVGGESLLVIDNGTPAAAAKVRNFYLSVEELFERWVTRRESPHTQRAYRNDIMSLLDFLSIDWHKQAMRLFTVTVGDVQRWRDWMIKEEYAPKTINCRVSSL